MNLLILKGCWRGAIELFILFRRGWTWLGDRLWLALPLLAIPAWWPFYREGLPRSLEGTVHLLRLGVLDYHIRQGMFYPRFLDLFLTGFRIG